MKTKVTLNVIASLLILFFMPYLIHLDYDAWHIFLLKTNKGIDFRGGVLLGIIIIPVLVCGIYYAVKKDVILFIISVFTYIIVLYFFMVLFELNFNPSSILKELALKNQVGVNARCAFLMTFIVMTPMAYFSGLMIKDDI